MVESLFSQYCQFHRILGAFPLLDIDVWNAYKILLAGKADISCIFNLTNEKCIEKFDEILADALIYGNELKGEEK